MGSGQKGRGLHKIIALKMILTLMEFTFYSYYDLQGVEVNSAIFTHFGIIPGFKTLLYPPCIVFYYINVHFIVILFFYFFKIIFDFLPKMHVFFVKYFLIYFPIKDNSSLIFLVSI